MTSGSAAFARFRRVAAPLLYAHRGAHRGELVENTMPAFEAAVLAQADGIELDVRASKDGVVMVFHDRTLVRLAGRKDAVSELTAAALGKVDLTLGARIPTLDQVLDLLAPTPLSLNVEIKGDGGRRFRLANLVSGVLRRRSRSDRERVLVSSFRPEVLLWLRGLLAFDGQPELPLGFLSDAENTGARRARMLEEIGRFPLVHPHFRLVTPEAMRAWKEAGRVVNVWTVDAPGELSRLERLGVDGIITNDPALARRVLARRQSASPDCGPGSEGL